MIHHRPFRFFWLLIFLISVLVFMAGGRIAPQDEETAFRMTANLLEGRLTITNQTITLDPQPYAGFLPHIQPRELITTWATPGIDGRSYSQFSWGQSILDIPLYLIGRLIGGELNSRSILITRLSVSMLNPIVIALTGWLIALFAARLGYSTRLSIGLALAYAFGSMAFAYDHTHFSEPASALMLVLAAYAIDRVRDDQPMRWLIAAGTALGFTAYIRERSVIILPIFVLYLVLKTKQLPLKNWIAFLLPIGIAGGLIGLENWLRFGSPTNFGFSELQHTSFTTPIVLGVYGLLISPGKGLLLYNPIAWLGLIGLFTLARRRSPEALLYALTVLVEVLFFGAYEFWTGGWNWGPRYLLPVLPFLILAAGAWLQANPSRLRRIIIVLLCLIGFAINLPSVLVDHSRYLVAFGESDPGHYLDRSILQIQDSPLIQQWPTVFETIGLYLKPDTWAAAQRAIDDHLQSYTGPNDVESLSTQWLWVDEFFRLNVPDFWWLHLALLGFSPIFIGSSVLVLLIGMMVSGGMLVKGLRAEG